MKYLPKTLTFFQSSLAVLRSQFNFHYSHTIVNSQNNEQNAPLTINKTPVFNSSSKWETQAKTICDEEWDVKLEQIYKEESFIVKIQCSKVNPDTLNKILDNYQKRHKTVKCFLSAFENLDDKSKKSLESLKTKLTTIHNNMENTLALLEHNFLLFQKIWETVEEFSNNKSGKVNIRNLKKELDKIIAPAQFKIELYDRIQRIQIIKWERQADKICKQANEIWKALQSSSQGSQIKNSLDDKHNQHHKPDDIKNLEKNKQIYHGLIKKAKKILPKIEKLNPRSQNKLQPLQEHLKYHILYNEVLQSFRNKLKHNDIQEFKKQLNNLDINSALKKNELTNLITDLKTEYMINYIADFNKIPPRNNLNFIDHKNYLNFIQRVLEKLNIHYIEAWHYGYVWRFTQIKSTAFKIINTYANDLTSDQKKYLENFVSREGFFIRQRQGFFFNNKKTYGNTATWSKINNLLKEPTSSYCERFCRAIKF